MYRFLPCGEFVKALKDDTLILVRYFSNFTNNPEFVKSYYPAESYLMEKKVMGHRF